MRRALALLVGVALVALGLGLGVAPAIATPTLTISGQIINDVTTENVQGATLDLFAAGDPETILDEQTSGTDGSFAFDGLLNGSYFVKISANGYRPEQTANIVVSGSDVALPTIRLIAYGTMSGSVEHYDGTTPIQVEAGYYSSGSWVDAGSTTVNPDGTYSLAAVVASGSYDLEFEVNTYAAPFLTTWYGDMLQAPDPSSSSAGVITATESQSFSGLNVTLAAAGYITGVVKAGGKPVPGVDVDAFDNALDDEYDAEAPSSSAGAYKIKVPAGVALEVETDGNPPYAYQSWNGHNGCDCTYDPVTVSAGATKTGINFNLLKNPALVLTILFFDDGSSTPEPVPGVVHLYKQVPGGYQLIDSQTSDSSTGEAEFEVGAFGNLRLRISIFDPLDNATVWIPIEDYEIFDPSSSDPSVPVEPDNPVCSVDLPNVQAGDARAVLIEVTPEFTECGPEPAIKKHTGSPTTLGNTGGSSTTVANETSTPTPTPTPTDTSTPTPSPSPVDTSAPVSTPKPVPASSDSALPWWIWLLIAVGVLVLIGLGVVLFRVRR